MIWAGVIIFGSVRFLPLKNNQTEKKKRNPNRTGTGPNRPVSVRFLRSKTEKTYDFFFFATEMCLSSASNLLPQNLINIIKKKKGKEVMLIVIFSEKTRLSTSNVGYMNREGMNIGSATKEQNARETAAAANTVFTSSAAKPIFFLHQFSGFFTHS
jgi:hypothetical protein